MLKLPKAPSSIQKGTPLKNVLGQETVACLAHNIKTVYSVFDSKGFTQTVVPQLEGLEFKARGYCIADAMKAFLPDNYTQAINILLASLTPVNDGTEDLGLAVMFYQPHGSFIERYGLDKQYNGGKNPFNISMQAQYEITQRFTAEFSIRPFLIQQQKKTLAVLQKWITDPNPHVRRLCSEGARPRLPWAQRIPAFVKDPSPILPILEALKNDPELYVRRSVANSLGDIAKDHPQLVFDICESWLEGSAKQSANREGATKEVKWLIRHALRHPAKKGVQRALDIRVAAK